VEKLSEHDVAVVCISLGSREQAKQWMEITNWTGELWVDTSTSGDVAAVSQTQSEPYATFRLGRGIDKLRLNDAEAQKVSESIKHLDMPELVDKDGFGHDGSVAIWPGDVFQVSN